MTKIEWTEETVNPVVGCTRRSPGCKNCYALRFAVRLSKNPSLPDDEREKYASVVHKVDGKWDWTGKIALFPQRLDAIAKWRKPRSCFMVSMGDLFHDNVPEIYIVNVFESMKDAGTHTFQVLTKRPKRMLELVRDMRPHFGAKYPVFQPWPIPNIWLGVTTEDQQRADERIPHLLQTPAAVRFVSVEPMLGPVDLRPAHNAAYDAGVCQVVKASWIIIGAETGPGRRPCRIEWVRDLVQQCKTAGVACFVKKLEIDGKITNNMADWPADLRVREYPR